MVLAALLVKFSNIIVAPLAKSVCSFVSLVQTNLAPNPFVIIVLRNAQADFCIRIWTYLVPILKKQQAKKRVLSIFVQVFFPMRVGLIALQMYLLIA